MRRLFILLLILGTVALPVSAMEFTAPDAPEDVQDLMPVEKDSFGDGLWQIIASASSKLQPDVAQAARTCLSLVAVVMLVSLLRQLPGGTVQVVELAGTLCVAALLLTQTNSLIHLGADTVTELSEYGKLLLPVMAAALAAQGGTTSSAALYAGTAAFDAVLCTAISKVLVPMVYMFLVMSVAVSAVGEEMLKKLRDLLKWLMSWCLKIILYIFTGYISITGVVSGTVDATAVKAAKLTISGMVPVVGGILSDASEAVLVSAGVMKNSVGVYGLLAVIAIWISPFLRLGIHYLLLKLTAAVCETFGVKQVSGLIKSFSGAMGLLLAMTGSVCILLMISMVCFMRGVG